MWGNYGLHVIHTVDSREGTGANRAQAHYYARSQGNMADVNARSSDSIGSKVNGHRDK